MSEKLDTPAILAFVCRRTAPGLSGENARPPVWLCMLRLVIPRRINLRSHRTESLQTDANSTAKKLAVRNVHAFTILFTCQRSNPFGLLFGATFGDRCSVAVDVVPVEDIGIEPMTFALQRRCSPS